MAERAGFDQVMPFTLDVARSKLATNRPIPSTILLADTGYGQGQVLMTPLHLALVYGALGTDGRLRHPVLLSTEEKGKAWLEQPLGSEEHLALLRDVLKVTVQDPKAYAHDAHIPGLDMAGKTGTAQGVNKKEMGWFASYHPASDPELVIIVGVEEAIHGSHDAMDITKKVLKEYYQLTP
jgi:penicillin-binding protein